MNDTNDDYIGVLVLAALLGISGKTVLNRRSERPWTLPPDCTPPGQSTLRWRRRTVYDWLDAQQRAAVLPPRRPGRPRKSDVRRHG